MNTPSPLIPQGTIPTRSRSHVRIAVFSILAVHVLLLGVLLLQGCKRTTTGVDTNLDSTNENAIDTWVEPTNPTPGSAASPAIVPLDSGRDSVTSTPPPPPATYATTVASPQSLPRHISTPPPPLGDAVTAPTPAAGATTHVIVSGDSFFVLAKKYQTSSRAIAEANPGVEPSRLRPGQKLNIPAPTPRSASGNTPAPVTGAVSTGGKVYEVKSGDNLTRIATSQQTTIAKLRAANKLTTDRIKVGQKLVIPASSAPAARESVPGIDNSAPPPRFN